MPAGVVSLVAPTSCGTFEGQERRARRWPPPLASGQIHNSQGLEHSYFLGLEAQASSLDDNTDLNVKLL